MFFIVPLFHEVSFLDSLAHNFDKKCPETHLLCLALVFKMESTHSFVILERM